MTYIKSPLNYTGGKYKLLDTIFNFVPSNTKTFVDLFCGGLNVGINAPVKTVVANDVNGKLIELYEFFKVTSLPELLSSIHENIQTYSLSKDNADGYNQLRKDYNDNPNPCLLFVLLCYSFNHMFRFNAKNEYNVPFGKNRSSFNAVIENNLVEFVSAIQSKEITFSNKSFTDFNFDTLSKDDVVYCDPPYLISNASYNANWTGREELQLLNTLSSLNMRGIPFVLSNVIIHKGMRNDVLIDWSKDFTTIYLDKTYRNCSYNLLSKNTQTQEVLVTNIKQDTLW